MTTELTPHETKPLAKVDPYDAFQQGTKEDLIMPFRTLVQGVSRKADTAKAGQFWDEIEDAYYTQMLVAIISVRRERALFDEDDRDAPPICASDDAVRPRQKVEHKGEMTTSLCDDCPFKNDGCSFSYGLLCHDLDNSEMFLIRVGGASRGAWKLYYTKGQKAGTPAYAVGTIIGSEKKTFRKGVAYVLTFSASGGLPEETVDSMREIVAEYQTVNVSEPPERDIDVEEIPFE